MGPLEGILQLCLFLGDFPALTSPFDLIFACIDSIECVLRDFEVFSISVMGHFKIKSKSMEEPMNGYHELFLLSLLFF